MTIDKQIEELLELAGKAASGGPSSLAYFIALRRRTPALLRVLRSLWDSVESAKILSAAMETCHNCKSLVLVDDGVTYCEDGCSYDCEDHEGDPCASIDRLHASLKRSVYVADAAIREAEKEPGV